MHNDSDANLEKWTESTLKKLISWNPNRLNEQENEANETIENENDRPTDTELVVEQAVVGVVTRAQQKQLNDRQQSDCNSPLLIRPKINLPFIWSPENIQKEQEDDNVLGAVIQHLQNGTIPTEDEVAGCREMRQLKLQWQSLVLHKKFCIVGFMMGQVTPLDCS